MKPTYYFYLVRQWRERQDDGTTAIHGTLYLPEYRNGLSLKVPTLENLDHIINWQTQHRAFIRCSVRQRPNNPTKSRIWLDKEVSPIVTGAIAGRTALQVHPGAVTQHSTGCILTTSGIEQYKNGILPFLTKKQTTHDIVLIISPLTEACNNLPYGAVHA